MGYHNIREGIAYSMNIITLKCLVDTVTPQLGVEYAKKMGITTLVPEDVTPSLGLGGLTLGVTNLEMTDAFASIANGGEYREPVFFTKILDHNGKVLIENETGTQTCHEGFYRFPDHRRMAGFCGKPEPLRHARFPAQHHQRGCCHSRNVHLRKKRYDHQQQRPVVRRLYALLYGGHLVRLRQQRKHYRRNLLPQGHLEKYHDENPRRLPDPGFVPPDSVEKVEICRKSGKLPVPGVCSSDPRGDATYTEYFAKGTAPTETCDCHVRVSVCGVSGGRPLLLSGKPACIQNLYGSSRRGYTDDSNMRFLEPAAYTLVPPPLSFPIQAMETIFPSAPDIFRIPAVLP